VDSAAYSRIGSYAPAGIYTQTVECGQYLVEVEEVEVLNCQSLGLRLPYIVSIDFWQYKVEVNIRNILRPKLLSLTLDVFIHMSLKMHIV